MFFIIAFLAFMSINLGIQYAKLSRMTTLGENVEKVLDEPTIQGRMNILLLGVDEGGLRSDTIMVVSVDSIKNEIKLLSIPRDTKITLSNGQVVKANALIGFDRREELVIETIKDITKMPIHYYCEVNFDGFKEIIDILGGVDYNVPYDMNYDDVAQDLHIHLKAGMQHLDGQAAHDFVRFRHNNKSEKVYAPGDYHKGDIGRIGAQQDFLTELFRQKMQPQYILKAPELINAAYKYVRTNFTATTALDCISMLKSISSAELETFILPGEPRYENNVSYYIYNPSETKTLILEEFGYPEDEAKEWEESQKTASAEPSEEAEISEEPEITEEPDAEPSEKPSAKASSKTKSKASASASPEAKATASSKTKAKASASPKAKATASSKSKSEKTAAASKTPESTRKPAVSID